MLRVGVVLDGLRAPAWVARVLASIRASDTATLSRVLCAGAPPRPTPSIARRLVEAVFVIADARVRIADPLVEEDVSGVLQDVPVVGVEDPEQVRDLDVLVLLGSRPVPQLEGIAAHGTWKYVAEDDVWEVITRTPVSRVALTTSSGEVLVESWSATDPYSLRRHRAQRYWKAASFVTRALRDLRLQLRRGPAATVPVVREPAAVPSARTLATTFVTFGSTVAQERIARLVLRDQWLLGYTIAKPAPFTLPATWIGDAPTLDLGALKLIVPPRERFWADPFVAPDGNGGWVIFFEDKQYGRPASLSAVAIDRYGEAGPAFPVLETPYHLSYPFVFRWQGCWWLMPETSRNATVELWRATEFPRTWQREHTLMSGIEAVDPTLFEHAGRWWMFCNIGERGATREDELHLFHAPSPLGPWVPHRMNPIKSNIRGARPAGHVFRDEQQALYRPAQDGSTGYGSQIILHRITELDVDRYREVETARIAPDRSSGYRGLHTINAGAGLTVIDTRIPRSRLHWRGRRTPESGYGRAVVDAD